MRAFTWYQGQTPVPEHELRIDSKTIHKAQEQFGMANSGQELSSPGLYDVPLF
jgi:hypothetical protein